MMKLIPDCYLPSNDVPAYVNHEAVCVLNTNKEDVTVELTLYFEDRDKLGGFSVVVPAERTLHIRTDKLVNADGVGIPGAVPYAMVVECDKEISVQYTRVDMTSAQKSITTTMI